MSWYNKVNTSNFRHRIWLQNLYIDFLIFQATVEFLKTNAKTDAEFKIIYSSLLLVTKIFYSLNFQVRVLLLPLVIFFRRMFLIILTWLSLF